MGVSVSDSAPARDSVGRAMPEEWAAKSYRIKVDSLDGSDGGGCFVQVYRENESTPVGAGVGTDLIDGLLDVIGYLLPPSHPEYPQQTPRLDDQ